MYKRLIPLLHLLHSGDHLDQGLQADHLLRNVCPIETIDTVRPNHSALQSLDLLDQLLGLSIAVFADLRHNIVPLNEETNLFHVVRQDKRLQVVHHRITVPAALTVEVEVIVAEFVPSEQVGVHHHDLLPLVQNLFKSSVPADQIKNDDGATEVILLQGMVMLQH